LTYDALIDRLTAQFDAPRATVESILNSRHKQLVAESRWRQSQQQVAVTVAGQKTYALPTRNVRLSDLKVDGTVYEWAPEADIWRIDSTDTGRWFSLFDDENGVTMLQITPAPETSGKSITALVSLYPSDLSYGSGAVLSVPDDFHQYLHAGAKADLYEEVDQRPDYAAVQEQKFEQGVTRLRARRHSLVGPRVTRARIAGRDFELS
jgi:hypothetical protein